MGLRIENTEAAEKAARNLFSMVRTLKTNLSTLNRNKEFVKEAEALAAIEADHAEIAIACASLMDVMTETEVIPTEGES